MGTESIEVGTRLNTSWTFKKQKQELISRSCPNCPLLIRCPRCPNSTDKRLDSYNLLMQKSEQQPPYHLIGPLNYHVQWFAFWAFAYIKLIPLKLHICWRTGMFDVANRCKLRHKKKFFFDYFFISSKSAIFACHDHLARTPSKIQEIFL